MADGIAITAGSGTTILTDDTGAGGHAQVMKLAISTDGSGTLISADAANGLDVDVTRLPALVAGTAYVGKVRLTDGTTDTNVSATGELFIGGAIAHDAADSGNPVKIGARAVAHGTNPTAVAVTDRTDLYANRAGIPFYIGGHPNIVTSRVTYTAAQTDIAIGPGTVAGGLKVVVTQIQITVSNATTATPSVIVGFGTANTPTGTGVVISHPGIPGGGGISRGDGSGILGVGADGEELRITISVPTGGTLDCVVSYFTIES